MVVTPALIGTSTGVIFAVAGVLQIGAEYSMKGKEHQLVACGAVTEYSKAKHPRST